MVSKNKRPPYWNSTSGFDFDHITAVGMSFCTSLPNFIQIGLPTAEKMTSCRFSRWRQYESNNELFKQPMYDFL